MNLEETMQDAFREKPDVSALACMDGRAGMLLGMYIRGEVPRDFVEVAAFSAPELCSAPSFDQMDSGDHDAYAAEAFVAAEDWIHAYVRVSARPDLVVVALAKAGTNVALLRSWLGEVAARVGQPACSLA